MVSMVGAWLRSRLVFLFISISTLMLTGWPKAGVLKCGADGWPEWCHDSVLGAGSGSMVAVPTNKGIVRIVFAKEE